MEQPPTKVKLMLLPMLGSDELAVRWWNSPNRAFNKLCPKDVDIAQVYSYLLEYLSK